MVFFNFLLLLLIREHTLCFIPFLGYCSSPSKRLAPSVCSSIIQICEFTFWITGGWSLNYWMILILRDVCLTESTGSAVTSWNVSARCIWLSSLGLRDTHWCCSLGSVCQRVIWDIVFESSLFAETTSGYITPIWSVIRVVFLIPGREGWVHGWRLGCSNSSILCWLWQIMQEAFGVLNIWNIVPKLPNVVGPPIFWGVRDQLGTSVRPLGGHWPSRHIVLSTKRVIDPIFAVPKHIEKFLQI